MALRAAGYGLPGEVVDGNDVVVVREAAGRAIARARAGDGPTLLELKTYRWGGHFEGDPRKYRTREEEEQWKARCPVARFRKVLLEEQGIEDERLTALEKVVADEVAGAITFAIDSPLPVAETALAKVYAA